METLLFDLSFLDFTQPPLCLSPIIEFHNLIQFALSVVILGMLQTIGSGKLKELGKGEEERSKKRECLTGQAYPH